MKFDIFRREVCDMMIIISIIIEFLKSAYQAISDISRADTFTHFCMFLAVMFFLIYERSRANIRIREYRKDIRNGYIKRS